MVGARERRRIRRTAQKMLLNLNLTDKRKGGTVREDTSKHEFEGDLHVEVNELVELCRNIHRHLGMYKWSSKAVTGLGLYV